MRDINEKSSLRSGASKITFKYVNPTTTSSDDENVVYAAGMSVNSNGMSTTTNGHGGRSSVGNVGASTDQHPHHRRTAAVEIINVASSDRLSAINPSAIDDDDDHAHNPWGEDGIVESSQSIEAKSTGFVSTSSLEDLMSRRNVLHPTSNLDVMMHIFKCNVGTGILAVPFAIKNAGMAVGTIGLVLITIICIHCMHLAVKCSHCLCVRTNTASLSYASTSQYAFATGPRSLRKFSKTARFLTNFFLCLTQLGFCCVYFVFVSNNMKDIVDRHYPNGAQLDYRVYAAGILLPIILTNLMSNFKFLSPASTVANILQMISFCIIFYYICRDIPPVSSRTQVADFKTLPIWFGTVIFAFEGIGLVLPLENSMKTPQDFRGLTGVLNTAMVLASCALIAIGFYGYAKYGDEVLGSITLNLPNELLADIVRGAYAFAIFLTYAIQFIVPIQVMWPGVRKHLPSRLHFVGEMVFRVAIILITFGLACLIPQLGLFISLVGSLSGAYLSLILPPVLELVTFWNEGLSWTNTVKDVTIFLVGVLGSVTGTYVSIATIIETFSNYN